MNLYIWFMVDENDLESVIFVGVISKKFFFARYNFFINY